MPARHRPAAGAGRWSRVPVAGAVGVTVLALVLAGSVAAPAAPAAGTARTTTARTTAGRLPPAFARARGGRTGIVVRDRVTGVMWRNADAATAFRAAATVKLGIAVDLLVRARAGGAPLDPAARSALTAMLTTSDNAAADRLWARSGGPAAGARLRPAGRDRTARWGSVRCTPEDLGRLVSYALERTGHADRATLVGLLRAVVPAQRWGVLGVAGTARPGAKNGWTPDGDSWAVSTVGFLGPGELYTVAVMTAGPPGSDFLDAVETVTGTVTTLVLGLS